MKKKEDTPDLRQKLLNEVVKNVGSLLREKGIEPEGGALLQLANQAIDEFVAQWYEVSLEAIELRDGEADFITDDEIDDPELIKEAKLRVIKELYEDTPEDFYRNIAENVSDAH